MHKMPKGGPASVGRLGQICVRVTRIGGYFPAKPIWFFKDLIFVRKFDFGDNEPPTIALKHIDFPDEAVPWQPVSQFFYKPAHPQVDQRFCLTAGLATLSSMMEEDAVQLCGPRYGREDGKAGHRWGKTKGKLAFHGGKVELERPRIRARGGKELPLPSWEEAVSQDLLGKWAMNLMLINVSTRKYGRAVRLPEGDIAAPSGSGVSKSAVSRRFVALSAARMKE